MGIVCTVDSEDGCRVSSPGISDLLVSLLHRNVRDVHSLHIFIKWLFSSDPKDEEVFVLDVV